MLGEISPHHEYYDSKSSTETPPSYNQLNYNENIERFFKSKPPVATMYGSDEENVNSSNDEGDKDLHISRESKAHVYFIETNFRYVFSAEVYVTDKRQRSERQR